MKLYTISGAPRGWRVQMALLFKQLDYDIHLLSGSEREHKKTPFIDIHHRGLVPVMEHEGQTITDSLGIMAWLDRQFPINPLFGASAQDTGKIWSLATDLEDHMRDKHHRFIFPLLVQKRDPKAMAEDEFKMMSDAAEDLASEFKLLENLLGEHTFFFGNIPSAADAVAYPDARLVQRTIEQSPGFLEHFSFEKFNDRYPKIRAWMNAIESLPKFETCLPPHWAN